MDLVSVIVPVYNAEAFLYNCIKSIIKQTYSNIEIILVNDGSEDNSGKICELFAKDDVRIIVINKKNSGVSDTRNCGINAANGKYICFIDADDTVDIKYIEKLIEPMQCHDYDLVMCNHYKVYDGIRKSNCFGLNMPVLTGCLSNDYNMLYSIVSFPWGKLFKLEVIKSNSILFPSDFPDAEDQMFNFQYNQYVNKYFYIDLPLYNYLQRNNSTSKNKSYKSFLCNVRKLYEEKKFYQQNSIVNYDELIISSCLWIAKKYVLLDSYHNSYSDYKIRMKQAQRIVNDELKSLKINSVSKRNIAALCLKYNLYSILYCWYRLRKCIDE